MEENKILRIKVIDILKKINIKDDVISYRTCIHINEIEKYINIESKNKSCKINFEELQKTLNCNKIISGEIYDGSKSIFTSYKNMYYLKLIIKNGVN